jgi:hypothetical protein
MRAADGHLGVAILRVDGGDHALFPGTTIADRSLQRDAFMLIVQKDLSELEGGPCRGRRITHTEVVSPLEGRQVDEGKPVAGQWAERWTLDRCGTSIHYILHFVTSRSGTRFFTERETEGAPTAAPLEPQRSAAPSVERRELAPGPSATPPPQPAASAPKDSGDAIDWLLKPRTH